MASRQISEIAHHMEGLLPADGAPVLNRVMRMMLTRDMRRAIDQETFFAARDLLLKEGRIGRLRGQGGQLFLMPPAGGATAAAPVAAADKARLARQWPEAMLMLPLRRYLESQFKDGLDLPPDAACIVEDTSTMGSGLGRWARPDFVLVSAMRFKVMPGSQIEVHSFELKTEDGANDTAVYEALAQTRFTHFGHLVWHLPRGSKAENRLPDIEAQCEEHGVGLIRMTDPDDTEAYEIMVDPKRKLTPAVAIDGFLESRLSDSQRKTLLRAINGAGR